MKSELPNSAAPDRLSTLEEIQLANATSPKQAFELCRRNSLLRGLRIPQADPVELSTDDLEFLVYLGEWEDGPQN